MLFAGWEVHIVKNCDLGLENAALGRIFSKLSNEKKLTQVLLCPWSEIGKSGPR